MIISGELQTLELQKQRTALQMVRALFLLAGANALLAKKTSSLFSAFTP